MTLKAAPEVGTVTRTARFEGFYRSERPGLYRALALTLGDPDLAAEAVDEAMARAYQRWRRVCGYDNPAGWVYRVGLNWAISRSRKRGRVVTVAAVHDERGCTDPAPPDDDLTAAVAALPDKQRQVVVLRYHLDWSIDKIGAALALPAGTVKSRLHRGLAALRENLESMP